MEKLASRRVLKKVGNMPIVCDYTPDMPPEDLSQTRTIDTLRPPHMSDQSFWYTIKLARCLRTHRQNGDKTRILRVSKPTPHRNPAHCENLKCHFAKSGTGGCPVNEQNKKDIAKFNPVELIVVEEEPIQLRLF